MAYRMVCACAVEGGLWLGEGMCGLWSGGCQARRWTKENLERDCGKTLLGT